MEDLVAKDQSSASGRSTSRLLRYPLRSASRSKDEKPPLVDSTNSASATKRGRIESDVSKSVSVLDLSGKEKSVKPPRRRLSVPSKSNAIPAPKSFANITPISEARSKRSAVNQGKSATPLSDVSKSSSRKKFSILSSASYWLSQIKLSEFAAKHLISLGFFKLALEAGCEPIERMSDELKSYVCRHNLSELEESVKELFESYKISENFEQSQVSENCSQVPTDGNQLSEDEIHSSSSSIIDAEKLKPKSLDINAEEVKTANSGTSQKDERVKKTGKPVPKNAAANSMSGSEVRGRCIQKKPQKPVIKNEFGHDKDKMKKQGKKSAQGEVPLSSPSEVEVLQENKENKAAQEMEEISLAEV